MGRRKPNKTRRERPVTWRTIGLEEKSQAVQLGTELAFKRNAIVVLELHRKDLLQTLVYESNEDFFQRGMLRASAHQSLVCLPDVIELEGLLNGMPPLDAIATHHNSDGRSARVFVCPDMQNLALAVMEAIK